MKLVEINDVTPSCRSKLYINEFNKNNNNMRTSKEFKKLELRFMIKNLKYIDITNECYK